MIFSPLWKGSWYSWDRTRNKQLFYRLTWEKNRDSANYLPTTCFSRGTALMWGRRNCDNCHAFHRWSLVCGPQSALCNSCVTGRRDNTFAWKGTTHNGHTVSYFPFWILLMQTKQEAVAWSCLSSPCFPYQVHWHSQITHPHFTSTQSHQLQADPLICYTKRALTKWL